MEYLQNSCDPFLFEKSKNFDIFEFVHESGEWYGYLNPSLEVNQRILGGPYKGCFHVPRGLWLTAKILEEIKLFAKL